MAARWQHLEGEVDVGRRVATDALVGRVAVRVGEQSVEVELTEMTDEEKRRIGIGVPQPEKGAAEDLNAISRVIAVMSGKAAATADYTDISGAKITLYRSQDRITVEGGGKKRVEAVFFPDDAQQSE